MKVSVLIPVYNVAPYMERCAHSVLSQTFQDIEYIFVDDCSPDNSIEILQNVLELYPHKKSSVKILTHEVNKGLSAARKTGMEAATGTYFLAMDSDDFIEPDMIELLSARAIETDADIVFCDYFEELSENISRKMSFDFVDNKVELIYDAIVGRCAYWNKLIKMSILLDNDIKPLVGVDYGEDLVVITKVIYHAENFSYVQKPLYHYNRCNTNAYTLSFRPKYIEDRLKLVSNIDLFFSSKNDALLYKLSMDMLKATRKLKILRLTRDVDSYMDLYPEINESGLHLPITISNKLILYLASKRQRYLLRTYLKFLSSLAKLRYA